METKVDSAMWMQKPHQIARLRVTVRGSFRSLVARKNLLAVRGMACLITNNQAIYKGQRTNMGVFHPRDMRGMVWIV